MLFPMYMFLHNNGKTEGIPPPPSEGETERQIHVGCVEGGGIGRGTAGARVR